jgi:hypothetical protein
VPQPSPGNIKPAKSRQTGLYALWASSRAWSAFLMIAGTYTPFTTCRLHGVWAIGMTAAVWTGALTGAVIKLICPSRIERVSIVAYLGLGWIIPNGDTTDSRFDRCLHGGLDRSWRASSIPLRLVFTSGGRCPSRRQNGTASCWWRRAATTQLFCMVWYWPDHEGAPCYDFKNATRLIAMSG